MIPSLCHLITTLSSPAFIWADPFSFKMQLSFEDSCRSFRRVTWLSQPPEKSLPVEGGGGTFSCLFHKLVEPTVLKHRFLCRHTKDTIGSMIYWLSVGSKFSLYNMGFIYKFLTNSKSSSQLCMSDNSINMYNFPSERALLQPLQLFITPLFYEKSCFGCYEWMLWIESQYESNDLDSDFLTQYVLLLQKKIFLRHFHELVVYYMLILLIVFVFL